MITLREMLRGRDPKGGSPLTMTEIYAANMISKGEADRVRLQQKRDEYRARARAKSDLRRDVMRMVSGGGKGAKGVPEAASQMAQRSLPFPQEGAAAGPGRGVPGEENAQFFGNEGKEGR